MIPTGFGTLILVLLAADLSPCQAAVSKSELSQLVQSLWNSDRNRLSVGNEIILDLQGYTYTSSNRDWAPKRLFKSVPSLTSKPTYRKFIDLLDNYNGYTDTRDSTSQSEKSEQQVFIASILGTNVWQLTREFLIRKGFITSTSDLTSKLHRIWFREYSRTRGILGSSGFEHVFAGEVDREKGEVIGAHNWVKMYLDEQDGDVNYMGYIRYDALRSIYYLKVKRGSYNKFGNSMFIGTSPEFEMALYTVCFLVRTDDECQFTLNNKSVTVKTHQSYNSALGSAYPLA